MNKNSNNSNYLTDTWISDRGEKLKFTFIDSENYGDFPSFSQCYCVCFNKNREVLIGRNPNVLGGRWVLPGGKPEKGENPEQTLKRELLEEVDVTIDKSKLIGAQKVEFLDDSTKNPIYQLRFVALIEELKNQTPDPDDGIIWERKFVKPEEVDSYLKWGIILRHIVNKSKEWYDEINKK